MLCECHLIKTILKSIVLFYQRVGKLIHFLNIAWNGNTNLCLASATVTRETVNKDHSGH